MLDLIISPETITTNKINIFGQIYFQLDHNAFFPDQYWDDFIIILLNEWIKYSIAAFYGAKVRCIFMDGPCHFTITPSDNEFDLEFFINNKHDCSANINQIIFLKTLKARVNLVIRTLAEKNIVTEGTIELQKNFNYLQTIIKKQP